MLRRAIAAAIRLPLRLLPKRAVLRVFFGPMRGMRWIAGAATHGCWIGTYERDAQRTFAERIRPGDVVYDVGANAGFFTLLASKLAGPSGAVYAFEPLLRNLELLKKHVQLNDAQNVHIVPLAVSDRAGRARFATADSAAMGGLSERGGIEVETTTLDSFRDTTPPPAFIKMDIEGAEHDALSGARSLLRETGPDILLSMHGFVQQQRCTALLREEGYELEVITADEAEGNFVVLAAKRTIE